MPWIITETSIHNNNFKTRFIFFPKHIPHAKRQKGSVLCLLLLEERDGLVLTSLCFAEAHLRCNYSVKESHPPSDRCHSSARESRDACTQPKGFYGFQSSLSLHQCKAWGDPKRCQHWQCLHTVALYSSREQDVPSVTYFPKKK